MLTFLAAPQAQVATRVAPLRAPIVSTKTGQLEPAEQTSTLDKVWRQTPNAITLAGYALGLWWCVGGPTWAAIVSILADEADGRLARAMNASSEVGSKLDWSADVALVPMSLLRLGRATGTGAIPVLAAPPILWNQATSRADSWRPPVGSWRAAIMIAAILAEGVGSLKRMNPSHREKK